MPDFRTAPRMLPVAAAFIALPSALALLACAAAGLPALVSGAVTVAVAAFTTGAFHEDGLADTFDGLGGGATPERRLEIMKDSRLGAFGGTALMLALILRVALLAALIDRLGAAGAARSSWPRQLSRAASRCFRWRCCRQHVPTGSRRPWGGPTREHARSRPECRW